MNRGKLKHIALFALFVLAALIIFGSGMNGVLWLGYEGRLQSVVRFFTFLGGVALTVVAVHLWSKWHVDTLAGSAFVAPAELTEKSRADAVDDLRAHPVPSLMGHQQLHDLALTMIYPASVRSRVEEVQKIQGATLETQVTVTMDTGNCDLPSGRLVMLTRMQRPQSFANFAIEAAGTRVHRASFDEGNAIAYRAALRLMESHLATLRTSDREEVDRMIAEIVLGFSVDRSMLAQQLASGPDYFGRADVLDAISALLDMLMQRRPVFAYLPDLASVQSITYSYVQRQSPGELPFEVDWWRRFKDDRRESLRLPSKFVAIGIQRAMGVETYSLHLVVPDGLYIDESYVVADGGARLENLSPDVARAAHINWSKPNGRPDLRLQSMRLGDVQGISNPKLYIRMIETPPGSVLLAVVAAATALLTSWLTGVVLGSLLRKVQGDGINVDVAALAVTLPAFAIATLGIVQGRTAGVYRSLTALLVLAVSLLEVLASLIIYVGRSAIIRFQDYLFPEGKSFFFLQDGLSAAVFVLGLVNFGLGAGLLIARLRRSLYLRRPK